MKKCWLILVLAAVVFGFNLEQSWAYAVADSFDYPVGKPDGTGYNKTFGWGYLEYTYGGVYHPGEDWNGDGGGNTDLGDSVYAIANGKVVYSGNCGSGWGNVIVVKHELANGDDVWSQYAHLQSRRVGDNDSVNRGEKIGTIGQGYNNEYRAHLHFEVRKKKRGPCDWVTGWSRDEVKNWYYEPSDFIDNHREAAEPDMAVSELWINQNDQEIAGNRSLKVYPGENITVKARIKNKASDSATTESKVYYYVSRDRYFDHNDEIIGEDSIKTLEGGDDKWEKEFVLAPNKLGIYYIGVGVENDYDDNSDNNFSDEDDEIGVIEVVPEYVYIPESGKGLEFLSIIISFILNSNT
ncbi:MAG: peptidoglycan DD-metalloendopeptidase family protein [Candidatus Moranbacteria bacterium]|nr:peptidoglycan DD-metalloendopeptidase family protein [Candidatus Moranbacteria bacterium]